MSTHLIILGHADAGGLSLPTANMNQLADSGGEVVVQCADCPVQNAGTAIVVGSSGLEMQSYSQRYNADGSPSDPALEPVLPKGAAVFSFPSATAARDWYATIQPAVGLHVAYFLDDASGYAAQAKSRSRAKPVPKAKAKAKPRTRR